MTILVTGGCKCGKSGFAESLLYGEADKYYIATMQPYGEEAHAAIARHLRMREGKGFVTVERFTDIGGVVLPESASVLLECAANLCANEMFRDGEILAPADKIVSELRALSGRVKTLVVVTNEVGSDGVEYSGGTMGYIECLNSVNSGVAEFSDSVFECVYGIPVRLK